MNASRLIAIFLVVGTVIWIGSAYLVGDDTADDAAMAQADDASTTGASGTANAPGTDGATRASVRTITSNAVDHVDFLRVSGRTEAVISVEIRAETEASVVELGIAKGQPINKGDLIAKLAVDGRMAQVQKARALVAQRELESKAAESLAEKNYRSKTGVAQTLALLEEARADLKIAQTELNHTEIRAPFDGIVENLPADIGDLMSIGDPVATLIKADPMLVVAHVPEHSIRAIDLGQLAHVRLYDGTEYDGIVRYAARVADNSTRTFRVEVEIDNTDLSIPDGMTAEMEIPVGTKRAHQVLPSVLTLNDDGKLGVRSVVDGNKVDFLPVELQGGNRERVWIGGLPEKFELIVVGHDWVKEGATVGVVHLETDENGLPIPTEVKDAETDADDQSATTLSEKVAR
ncbi:efflux RND transporter periplasmic adaptor subunit [Thalassospira sp. GB04J01]|uniref:efflux RND transporter periplasmic adaptor subunit n=1 Tax=Thalassospira TaxID=168934 RepID=UPI000C9C76AE|nr:efflux RND transporter periplasmic adaptor subunit [Thalassospira sp. GB04J01]|tara:strand:+ start:256594 stop:257805 length:1212 start_codon:yes stop_codon:yes gene_type:complete